MNMRTWYWRSSIAVIMVVMALFAAIPQAFAEGSTPSVVPINGTVGGRTYGQWSAEWWHRAFAVTSLDDCTLMNQPEPNQALGPVWFLAGTANGTIATGRTCTVPAGKFIMFPIFNTEWSKAEALAARPPSGGCFIPGVVPTGTEDAALRACAKAQADHGLDTDTMFAAKVDGITLPNLKTFRAASPFPPFTFTPPPTGDVFGVCAPPVAVSCPASTRQAVADGFWIILNPLSPGQHTIDFSAFVPFFNFTTGAMYTVTVQPAK